MEPHNNPSLKFQAILFSSGWMRHIIFQLSTSVFSVENKWSKSDSSLILLSRICYQKILISKHHDIIRPIDQGFIFPDKKPSGYITICLFIYRVSCICNRLFSLPSGLSKVFRYRHRNYPSCYGLTASLIFQGRRREHMETKLLLWRTCTEDRLATVGFPSHCP